MIETPTAKVKEIIEHGDSLFLARGSLMSLWQEQAENFYPERADFTITRNAGDDFASHLNTSYPLIVRRELGNSISGMIRPRDEEWFATTTNREEKLDLPAKRWLAAAAKVQRRAMYDPVAQFVRATKEGDHDFVTFGQCVLSVEWDLMKAALLYRCHHLRDAAWCEAYNGQVGAVHVNWNPTAGQLAQRYGEAHLHANAKRLYAKNREERVKCRRVVLPAEEYGDLIGKTYRQPYVLVTIDLDNKHILEQVPSWTRIFHVPRWQTVSGSQYSYSPATIAALPDARLIQAMALTILEAGEMAARPAMFASKEFMRSDINHFSGGWTYIDTDDRKLSDLVMAAPTDLRGLPFSKELSKEVQDRLYAAFYLNKLNLPEAAGHEMTAYETGERVKEWIRSVLPLFEPMETEYNSGLCDDSFELIYRYGGFGSPLDVPESLRGRDIKFKFMSPLHDAIEKKQAVKFQEALQIITIAVQTDPVCAAILDARKAARAALEGNGTPPEWLRDEKDVEKIAEDEAMHAQAQKLASTIQTGAAAAQQVGDANQALRSEVA